MPGRFYSFASIAKPPDICLNEVCSWSEGSILLQIPRHPQSRHSPCQSHLIPVVFLYALLLAELLFRPLPGFLSSFHIDLLRALHSETEQLDPVVDHLHETGAYRNSGPVPLCVLITHFSRNDSGNRIDVMGEKSLLAVLHRDHQRSGAAGVKKLVACIDLQTERTVHKRFTPYSSRVFAFSITSSIVPTLKNAFSG